MSLTAASVLAALRPLTTTRPPSATNRRATSLPMPEFPPVTIATLSSKRIARLLLDNLSIDRQTGDSVGGMEPSSLYLSIDRQSCVRYRGLFPMRDGTVRRK